jgi:tetratricopeptide (TPR) repeat protein
MTVNNLANRLGDVGRREEALARAEESVHIRRQLAEHRPDAFLPGLASSASSLARRLADLGRQGDALMQAEESVRIYRELAERRPDTFLPEFARSLGVRGEIIAGQRPEEAIEPLVEAIRLLTPFFSRLPHAHAPLMRALRGLYLQAAQSARVPPDAALLAPVNAVFESIESPDNPSR